MPRNSPVNSGSRSWIKYRLPVSNPSTASVRFLPIWLIHRPFALVAMPAISTSRVDSSMKKSTTNRCSPRRVHTSTLLAEDTILFPKVVNNLQLALIHPPGEGDQHEPEWIQDSRHSLFIIAAVRVERANPGGFKQIRFPDQTRSTCPRTDVALHHLQHHRARAARWPAAKCSLRQSLVSRRYTV